MKLKLPLINFLSKNIRNYHMNIFTKIHCNYIINSTKLTYNELLKNNNYLEILKEIGDDYEIKITL